MTVLSLLLAVVVIAVLAVALIEVRTRLRNISTGLATLADALETVENEHLQAARAGREGHQRAVRRDPVRAARHRRQGRDRGREEAVMTLAVGLILLVVVFPVVVILLHRVLAEANAIVPSVERIRDAARAGSKDLDAVPLLLTTQRQVKETVENVAAYGGSLDVILDDAR